MVRADGWVRKIYFSIVLWKAQTNVVLPIGTADQKTLVCVVLEAKQTMYFGV